MFLHCIIYCVLLWVVWQCQWHVLSDLHHCCTMSRNNAQNICLQLNAFFMQIIHKQRICTRLRACCSEAKVTVQADVRSVLGAGADPDAPDARGRSPLLIAAKHGHSEISQELLDHGADAGSLDRNGMSAMHHACIGNHVQVLNVLLRAQASSTTAQSAMPTQVHEQAQAAVALHTAVQHHALDCVRALLQYGCDVQHADALGRTALHIAALQRDSAAIVLLLQHDKHIVDMRDAKGCTAVHLAAGIGSAQALGALFAHGAHARIRDTRKRMPLAHAVQGQHSQAVYTIVAHVLSQGCMSQQQHTDYAGVWAALAMREDVVEERYQKLTRALLDAARSEVVLVEAVQRHDAQAVMLLLDGGANPNARRRSRSLMEICLLSHQGLAHDAEHSTSLPLRLGTLPLNEQGAAAAPKLTDPLPELQGQPYGESLSVIESTCGADVANQVAWALRSAVTARARIIGCQRAQHNRHPALDQLAALRNAVQVLNAHKSSGHRLHRSVLQ